MIINEEMVWVCYGKFEIFFVVVVIEVVIILCMMECC